MSQFNAPKNPPWVRSDSFAVPQMTQTALHQQMLTPQMAPVVQYQQTPGQQTATVYQAQLALQQQALNMQQTMQQNIQQMASAQQIYNPQINAVAAAAVGNRNLNTAAFAQPVVAQNPGNAAVINPPATTSGTKQRVFTGIVTKVLDTYGFVDEDVFFQLSVVKGPAPVVNDRVLVEAVCLPNMPFKWNATRIQVLPMNDAPRGAKKGFVVSTSSLDRGNYTAVPPPGEYDESLRRDRDRDRDRRRGRSRERNRNRSPLSLHDDDRRRRERRDRDDKEKEREKDRERVRSRSPKKSTQRPQIVKKYRVRVPEFPLDVSNLSVCDLLSRYHTMYVPSDFFRTTPKWQETFPPHQPMTFSRTAQFHVLHREVDPIFEYSDVLEPPDADYLFCSKVMLLSLPTKEVMMKKCMQLTEELGKDDDRNLIHPSRLINCLVGANTRGKNEIMAIGGPWSPSLDGTDPAGDPNVLIKTAIRTCRALTGVDLTSCTHWYRFAEIYYHRSKSTHKGKQIPARVETVVIYVPDVWSAMPSCLEWDGLHLNLKKQLDKKLIEAGKDQTEVPPDNEKVEGGGGNVKEPTHYSQLDPKVMKVSELRDELEARNMSSKGLRLQLLARLTKVLKTEQETAELEDKNKSASASGANDKEKEREEEKKQREDRDKKKSEQKSRAVLEERYALPEEPHILVYPSRTAKSGKFICKVMSLSLLLDYSSDVSKEHTFEVSLFAELFNEMLMRDFGVQVYRAVYNAPEIEDKEDSERKEEKDKDKKDEKDEKKTEKLEKGKDDKDDKEKAEKNTEKSDKTEEKDHRNEKSRNSKEREKEDEKRSEHSGVTNGEKENSHETSDNENDDDSLSRDSGNTRKDKKDDRRDRKKKESIPHYTANAELLLAFTYFDVTRYGRISGSHMEDLIHTLGLQLSRSQVKKLVSKVLHREYCDYRKLTDLPVGTSLTENAAAQQTPSPELGNKVYLPIFQSVPEKKEVATPPPTKRARRGADKESPVEKAPEGFVHYKGALVSIENLNEQVARNETARLKTEEKLTGLKSELNELKEVSRKSTDEVKSLQKELKECKSKLLTAVEKLDHQVASSDIYLSALMDIEERLIPILDTDEIKRLIKARQSVVGAPSINLVPLTKVEDISRFEDEGEEQQGTKVEKTVVESKKDEIVLKTIKEEKMDTS